MGDSEQDSKSEVPDWQRSKPQEAADSKPSSRPTPVDSPVTIERAKRFLQDEEVRKYSREKKGEFLKSKGFGDDVVQHLLEDEKDEAASQKPIEAEPQILPTSAQPVAVEESKPIEAEPQTLPTPAQPAVVEESQPVEAEPQTLPTPAQPARTTVDQPRPVNAREDRPPIVTYPEFLTKPARPPPLMTVERFLNTLYAFGGLSTLVYGTSKFVVAPMVDNLTEARISLYDTVNDNLSRLVKKLEETVSEIPPSPARKTADLHAHGDDDASSEYDDPTELFHRDIGVQTSLPPSPKPFDPYTSLPAGREEAGETAIAKQARRLEELNASVKDVSEGFVSQTEDYEDIKTVLGVFKDDVSELSYPGYDFGGPTSLYGYGGRNNEPDDEIKKAKENIRRVKGVLLSARSFPAGR